MNKTNWILGAAIGALFAVPALAQSALDFERRDLNQEQRILQGLQSGSLTAQEAARLRNGTQQIDRMESRALRDGQLESYERARIDAAQDRLGQQIRRESSDRQTANPNSPESRRMQEHMEREIRGDQRQLQGMRDGSYSNREVARQEWGDARNGQFDGRGNRQYEGRGDQGYNGRDHGYNQGRSDRGYNGGDHGYNRDHGDRGANGRDFGLGRGRGEQTRGDANPRYPGRGDHVRGQTQTPAAAGSQGHARPAAAQRQERTVVASRQTPRAGQTRPQGDSGGRR
jgi:hypothetical protein